MSNILDNEILAHTWDFEMNMISPEEVTLYSNKKYYWKCNKGHASYLTSPQKRMRNQGCPICSNHKIVAGINDFESNNIELMKEWSWDKNKQLGILPDAVSSKSGIKVWWKCVECQNEWQASLVNRVAKGSGCPYCANLKVKTGFNDLKSLNPTLAREWDYEKNGDLLPENIVATSDKKVWWKCPTCGNSWQNAPLRRKKRGCPYCSNKAVACGYNDLETTNPELLDIWDYEKNKYFSPQNVVAGSEKKVYWLCEKKHSWKATINSVVGGNRCPYCSNKKVLEGYNDIATVAPWMLLEWNYEKNVGISPQKLTPGSEKRVWWICAKCNAEWKSIVYTRKAGQSGCPNCAREAGIEKKLIANAKINALFSKHPNLINEWDEEKNSDIDKSLISAASNKMVWWKCKEGHTWKAQICTRTLKGTGCPYCSHQKVIKGESDLETVYPRLAKEWDYEKNAPMKPSDYLAHGTQHVWWKCTECGFSWNAKINNRANGRGCPNCCDAGTSFIEQAFFYYIKKSFSDAKHREKVDGQFEYDIWIPSKRIGIEYDGAYYHQLEEATERELRKNIWSEENSIRLIRLREKPLKELTRCENLKCECDTWDKLEESINSLLIVLGVEKRDKISIKSDYEEIVNNKKKLRLENAFGRDKPYLLAEWDDKRNAPLNPDYFTKGSQVKVWWKCNKGHEWQACIANRYKGTGCPFCFAERRSKGLNKKR